MPRFRTCTDQRRRFPARVAATQLFYQLLPKCIRSQLFPLHFIFKSSKTQLPRLQPQSLKSQHEDSTDDGSTHSNQPNLANYASPGANLFDRVSYHLLSSINSYYSTYPME